VNINPADVKRTIQDEDDFGHEMRVGSIFSEHEELNNDVYEPTAIEKVEHGGTYTDPSLGKPRQFDYRCQIRRYAAGGRRENFKCVALAVECKNLHASSPLVICGRPRTEDEAFHNFIESGYDEPSKRLSWVTKRAKGYRSSDTIYPPHEFVGKSLVRLKKANGGLKTDSQSDVYDKWSQAVQSSVELAEEASQTAIKNNYKRVSTLILPVVVVPNETLWMASYSENGTITEDPAKVDQCEFFLGRKIESGTLKERSLLVLTHIHFVTIKGFADFLSGFLKPESDARSLEYKWSKFFPFGSEDMTF
jgi:hypothetical protein